MTPCTILKRYVKSELATLDQEIDELNKMEDPYWNTVSEIRYNTLTDILEKIEELEPKRAKKKIHFKRVPPHTQIPMFNLSDTFK
jgi:hypothetical protein